MLILSLCLPLVQIPSIPVVFNSVCRHPGLLVNCMDCITSLHAFICLKCVKTWSRIIFQTVPFSKNFIDFILATLVNMVNGLLLDNSEVWIGLNDQNKNRRYTWQDSSRLLFTNWDKSEPQRTGVSTVQWPSVSNQLGRWLIK